LKILNAEINLDNYANRGIIACLLSLVAFAIAASNLWFCGSAPNCIKSFVAYLIAVINVGANCGDN